LQEDCALDLLAKRRYLRLIYRPHRAGQIPRQSTAAQPETIMPQRLPLKLTPEDQKSIRTWSTAMTIIYSKLTLSLLAVLSIRYGSSSSDIDLAAALAAESFATEMPSGALEPKAAGCQSPAINSGCSATDVAFPP
jgi:hypothetical protein